METKNFKILIISEGEKNSNTIYKLLIDNFPTVDLLFESTTHGGISIIKNECPQIVITEIKAPNINGLEISKTIYVDGSSYNCSVIMLINGMTDREYISDIIRNGADYFVSLPINETLLISQIKLILQKHSTYPFSITPNNITKYAKQINELEKEISKIKDINLKYEKTEEQLKRAISYSPIPIMIHDEDDNIIQISKGWTEYSGYTLEDIPVMPEWTQKAYGSAMGVEKQYIDNLFEIDDTVDNGEWEVTTKNGEKKIWHFKTTPLGLNINNKRLLHSLAIDITERKVAEEKIAKANFLLEETGRMAKIGGWELNVETKEAYFTDETFKIYGIKDSKLPTVEEGISYYAPESRPIIAEAVKQAMENSIPYDLELQFLNADGERIWIRTQGKKYEEEGKPARLMGTIQDITERKIAEKALLESEERLRRAIAGSPIPIMIHDEDGKVIQLSVGWTHYSGYTIEDIPTIADWTEKAYGERTGTKKDYIDQLFNINNTIDNGEWEVTTKDGSVRIWNFKATPLGEIFEGKRVLHSMAIDITDQKLIEETQAFLLNCGLPGNNEDYFETLANYLADVFKIDYVLIGKFEPEDQYLNTLAIVDKGVVQSNISFSIDETPCKEVVSSETYYSPDKIQILFPDDSTLKNINAEGYYGKSLFYTKGNPIGLIELISTSPLKDISQIELLMPLIAPRTAGEIEKRLSDEKIKDSEEKFINSFEYAPIGIALVSIEGRFLRANQSLCRLLGFTEEELTKLTFQQITHPEDVHENVDRRKQLIDGQIKTYQAEKRYISKSGKIIWALLSVTLVKNSKGDNQYFVSQIQDLTEFKKAQATLIESQRLGAIGEMSSAIAHDFNNSLQSISGNLELALIKLDKDIHIKKYLDTIKISTEDAAVRVNMLQRFAGKSVAEKNYSPINVTDIINEVISQSRPLWKDETESKGKTIKITRDFQDNLFINGKSAEIRTVLYNLVKNSIEAMPEGGEISFLSGKNESFIFIRVSDNGIGMNDEVKSRVFQPFYSTKGYESGRGLGLSGAYSIVNEHGGFIKVLETDPGNGTTIEISLPELSENISRPSFETPTENEKGRLKVLWVDDDNLIRESVSEILEVLGHSCTTAIGGKEALAELDKNEYDLLITDLGMPEMNGWELAEKVKEKFKGKLNLIVVTGWGDQVDQEEKNKFGISHVISKPFNLSVISKLLEEISKGSDN